jgi:hypothetical protein
MAREYGGDLYDFGTMSDDEIRGVVMEHLREQPNLDADWIDVTVREGLVTLSGRVGTDAEVQVAGAVLDDVLGLEGFSNELVVDELHRGETPEGADEAAAREDDMGDEGGIRVSQQSDTAEHLEEDLGDEQFGTQDMGEAIRDGVPYEPPTHPISDGYGSRENH